MSNTFYIVRHGESENNVLEIYNSHPEDQDLYGLTETGRDQIQSAAENIDTIHKIFTSPFRRTRETAAIFQEHTGADLIVDARLREIDLGDLHHQPHIDLPDLSEPEAIFGGESIAEIRDRMVDFVHHTNQTHQGCNILIVTHGGPMEIVRHYLQSEGAFRFSGLTNIPKNGVVLSLALQKF